MDKGCLGFLGTRDCKEGETILNIGKETHSLQQMGPEKWRYQKRKKSRVKHKSILQAATQQR